MSPDKDAWNVRNEMLNAIESAIEQETRGRLSRLSIDVCDGLVVVEACSTTYYAIQLAIAAIQRFVVEFPRMRPAKLTFHVNGRPFVLREPYGTRRNERTTTRDELSLLPERVLSDLPDDEPWPSTRMQPVVAAGTR